MKNIVSFLICILSGINFSFTQNFVQLGNDIDGEAMNDISGGAVSMPNNYTIAIGGVGNDDNGINSGQVRIYQWNGSAWVQKGSDLNGEVAGEEFGASVHMPDENTVAVGSPTNDSNGTNSGVVRVYKWSGSDWQQLGLDLEGESSNDQFGISVSMSDSMTLAIGAHKNDGPFGTAGHVRIYRWNGGAWVQKGLDIAGESTGEDAGYSVSMPDSNTVAIGARSNANNGAAAGQTRIYHWIANAWVQKGSNIDGEAAGDWFGWSVSMPDINTIAVGAPYNEGNGVERGHARVFFWNGNDWQQKGLDIDGETDNDNSAQSVSMPNSNTIAIGAGRFDGVNGSESGRTRVFTWNGSAWVQKGTSIDGEALDDYSGNDVCMPDENTVAIGAIGNDAVAYSAGHVRVYSFSPISNVEILQSNFSETLTAFPNPTFGQLTIDLKTNYSELSITIKNVLGQQVTHKTFADANFLQFEVQEEAGVYFVELKAGDKKAVFRVVKK